MKNRVKLVVVALLMSIMCIGASAQTIKLAHINLEELVMAMPEYETAQENLQSFVAELEAEMEEMMVERNRKLDEFQRLSETWSDMVRDNRAQELDMMHQRISAFQEGARENIMQEQNRLLAPVLEKANKAIEEVAIEQGITYVISSEAVLFKASGAIDLLPAVKLHLGLR